MADESADGAPQRSSSWFRSLCCSILQAGEIPHHIAIIMDGNRRFAQKIRQERIVGHTLGFQKLREVYSDFMSRDHY